MMLNYQRLFINFKILYEKITNIYNITKLSSLNDYLYLYLNHFIDYT